MAGRTQIPICGPAGGLPLIADRFGEGVVICDVGKIVWASTRAIDLLGAGPLDLLVGDSISALLEDSGAGLPRNNASCGVLCRIRSRGEDGPLVRVSVLEVGANEPGEWNSGSEIWLLEDTCLELEVENLNVALAETAASLESTRSAWARDRDELVAILSHELRTPLTVISGYNRLLLSGKAGELSGDQRSYVEQCSASCDRLNSFVVDLLDESHERSDVTVLARKDLPVAPAIRAVVDFFAPILSERDLRVDVSVGENIPPGSFDPGRIEQVVTNLLGNAIKYTKSSSTINMLICEIKRGNAQFIEVTIIDDGPGVAFEDRERIFEPYVRGSGSGSVNGIGLGLAICQRIVEAHGGEIGVHLEPGRGSRFDFTIPASKQKLSEES